MSAQARFQELLREGFQFESADLDFGIKRVLVLSRKRVSRFAAMFSTILIRSVR